jgi:hypothetical protein
MSSKVGDSLGFLRRCSSILPLDFFPQTRKTGVHGYERGCTFGFIVERV